VGSRRPYRLAGDPSLLTYSRAAIPKPSFDSVNFNTNLIPGTVAFFNSTTYKGWSSAPATNML